MGNCLGSQVKSMSPSNRRPSIPGHSASNISMSSSTFGQPTGSGMIIDNVSSDGLILEVPNLRVFTYAELKSATNNFKPTPVLGEGGFWEVFKGWVDEKTLNPAKRGLGMVVAVKKHRETKQGIDEWQTEVNFLGRLSHPNLVKLLGYCREDTKCLLVYEFMANGSLDTHLFRKGAAFELLSWSLRLKIAIGAARALAFLHSSDEQIIHCNFRASSILLDSNYNPKLSNFNLAKHGPTGGESSVFGGELYVCAPAMGTFDYAAPEYGATGRLSAMSDVYGYGVVLLEILSGQRAVDRNRPDGQLRLVDWAKPFITDHRTKLASVMDPQLEGQYPREGAHRAAQLTMRCTAERLKNRPSMTEVVEALEQIDAMEGGARQT